MDFATEQRAVSKWGVAGNAGFQLLPDLLLKKQVELGLTATDMLVLVNVTMHWWYATQRPFPRATVIAARMGVDKRTVQRSLHKMEELKLLVRVKETIANGEERLVCDLTGLVARLESYAANDPDYQTRRAYAELRNSDLRPIEEVSL